MAPEAAARRRAPRRRPLPGLQRAPHLAHGPDGDRHLRPARPRLRGRRRPDVLLRHPAPPARPGGLGRALRQPHGRAAPEDGAARGGHVVPVVHPVLRRGARRPTCRSPSATPPSSSPTAWTAASSPSPGPSRPPSRSTTTGPASPGSARAWRPAGSSRPCPGVKVVEFEPDLRWGRTCTPALKEQLGPEVWRQMVLDDVDRALAAGATHMAGIYHGCHRDLCRFEAERPIVFEHYLTLFGARARHRVRGHLQEVRAAGATRTGSSRT